MVAARQLLTLVAAAGALAIPAAWAQNYPGKAVYWSVSGAPGSAPDVLARALLPLVGKAMGQPQIIENRAGASGIAATDYVAKAAPDGYRLLLTANSPLALVKYTHANLPYDPRRDIAPISVLGNMSLALFVHASVPATSFSELLALSKANPGKFNYASAGIGHSLHFGTELLKLRTGLDITHVPYKTITGAVQDLFAGRVQAMFFTPSSQLVGQVKEGKIRAIATVSEKRFPRLPDTPTFRELGVSDFDVPSWIGIGAPAGTPREIITRWHAEVVKAMNTPEMARIVEQLAIVPVAGTPEHMAETITREFTLWGPVAASVGIKPE